MGPPIALQVNFTAAEVRIESKREAMALSTADFGAGTFVSSMPSLTKLRSSFTAKELALFTHRLDSRQAAASTSTQTRYHTASHPTSESAARSKASNQSSEVVHTVIQRSLPSSTSILEENPTTTSDAHPVQSSWRQVDSSIDQIFEDPSIDLVQLHLLQSHHSTTGQKKRKVAERERVLAAASDLRDLKSEQQRRLEQKQQRKAQIQELSEAIRLRNQKLAKPRPANGTAADDRRGKLARLASKAPDVPLRKPPVPRLSGQTTSKRRKKPKSAASQVRTGVSASILLGEASIPPEYEEKEAESDNQAVEEASEAPEVQQTTKRKAPATVKASKVSKKKKQSEQMQPQDDPRAAAAAEQRRAMAREYMQLQKLNRKVWSAKRKEQEQREQEKRQQQLEILEATRLKNLRLSKKRATLRAKESAADVEMVEEASKVDATAFAFDSSALLPGISRNSRVRRDKATAIQLKQQALEVEEQQLDGENDCTKGNLLSPAGFSSDEDGAVELRPTGAKIPTRGGVSTLEEAEGAAAVDERVKKLLELTQRTRVLSARLSGLVVRRHRDEEASEPVEQPLGGGTAVRNATESQVARDKVAESNNDDHEELLELKERGDRDEAQEEQESVGDDDEQGEDEAEAEGSVSGGEHSGVALARDEEANLSVDSEVDEEVAVVSSSTSSRHFAQQEMALNATTDMLGVHEEALELDIRSIGVHSIGVVWPVEQQHLEPLASEIDVKESSGYSSRGSPSSSSSSSSSSRSERSALPSRSRVRDAEGTAFELEELESDEPKHESQYDQEERDDGGVSDGSDVAPAPRLARRTQAASPIRRQDQTPDPNQRNSGLLRLIRETDDTLSVVDRAAKRLFQQQRDRLEREEETRMQRRLEAEKQTLLEKDRALEAVMASLTGKGRKEENEGSPDEEEETVEYKRLEEIMAEVEKERSQEKEEAERSSGDDSASNSSELEPKQPQQTTEIPISSAKPAVNASSVSFWDQQVSNPDQMPPNVAEPSSGLRDPARLRVEIDDSELVAQREARFRLEEEGSPARVHSPRSLSKQLMAAVDYQEAIFEAHLQLSMMEHAQELESAQSETLAMATAFKEEMEQNASSQQLALDHATLEKRFDGDLQEVLQHLEGIQRTEEQERQAEDARKATELKRAQLRESSVQTEAADRKDAATCAALQVETGCSPIQRTSDAAVQYEAMAIETGQKLPETSEDPEDYGEEGFEQESHLQVAVESRRSRMSSSVADFEVETSVEKLEASEIDSEGDAEMVESEEDRSGSEEESFLDESTPESVMESALEVESKVEKPQESIQEASVGYEDDFEASSPKMKAVGDQRSQQDTSEGLVEEEAAVADSSESEVELESEIDEESGHFQTGDEDKGEYSSQFDEASIVESSKPQDASQPPSKTRTALATASKPGDEGSLASLLPPKASVWVPNEADGTQSVAEAYALDLERRKQTEESLLTLRLRAVELKFQNEVAQLDNRRASTPSEDVRAIHTLTVRRETLLMAFLAEKANVESLRAASTARYYQDLHTFRSLTLEWPQVVVQPAKFESVAVPTAIAHVPKAAARQEEAEYEEDFESGRESDRNSIVSEFPVAAAVESNASMASEHPDSSDSEASILTASRIDEETGADEVEDVPDEVPGDGDEYDDDFASVSEVASTDDVVVAGKQESEAEASDYEEEFASISASTPPQAADAAENSMVEDHEDAGAGEQDDRASSSGAGEISDEAEALEEEETPHDTQEDLDLSENYADDEFESGQLDPREALQSEQQVLLQGEESASLAVAQSGSEDSSTTKLLLAEASRLATDLQPAQAGDGDSKVARKKAKAVELMEAKARLLTREKERFRQEEEKRQVDVIAKLALGLDVEKELHSAKTEIAQQLASEFQELQETYPMLRTTSSSAVVSPVATPAKESEPLPIEEEGEEDYAIESFEEEQSEVREEEKNEIASDVASEQPDDDDDPPPDAVEEEEVVEEQHEEPAEVVESESEDSGNDYAEDSFDDVQSAISVQSEPGGEVLQKQEVAPILTAKAEDDEGAAGYDEEDGYSEEAFDSASDSGFHEASLRSSAAFEPPVTTESVAVVTVVDQEDSEGEEKLSEAIVAVQFAEESTAEPGRDDPELPSEVAAAAPEPLAASMSVSLPHNEEEETLTKSIEERMTRLQRLKEQISTRKSEILTVHKQMRIERRKGQLTTEENELWGEMEAVEKALRTDAAALELSRQRNRLEATHLQAKQQEHLSSTANSEELKQREGDLLLDFDYIEQVELDAGRLHGISRSAEALRSVRGPDLLEDFIYVESAEPGDREEPEAAVVYEAELPAAEVEGDDEESGEEELLEAAAECESAVEDPEVADDEEEEELVIQAHPTDQLEDGERSFEELEDDAAVVHEAEDDQPSLLEDETDPQLQALKSEETADPSGVEKEDELVISGTTEGAEPSTCSDEKRPSSPDHWDLLGGFAYVEAAETPPVDELDDADLLASFEFVEGAEAVEERESFPRNEAPEEFKSDEEGDAAPIEIPPPALLLDSSSPRLESAIEPVDSTIEEASASYSSVYSEESAEPRDLDDVKDDNTPVERELPLDPEVPEVAVDRDEELADRVASLVFTELLQTLGDGTFNALPIERAMSAGAQVLHDSDDTSEGHEADEVIEILDEGLDERSREDEDSNLDEMNSVSEDATRAEASSGSELAVDPAQEAPESSAEEEENAAVTGESDRTAHDEPLRGESIEEQDVTGVLEEESHRSVDTPSGEASDPVAEGKGGVDSSIQDECPAAFDAADEPSKLLESERVADWIFASVFDETVTSELQLWSPSPPRQPQLQATEAKTSAIATKGPVLLAREPRSQGPNRRTPLWERDLAQRIADQLEVVDNQTAHALYDAIEELAHDCFNAVRQSEAAQHEADGQSALALVQQHVVAEIHELLAIRLQSEGEVERQMQLIADERGDEAQVTGDLLLRLNCLPSNASSFVAQTQRQLARPTEGFAATSKAPPHTPTSRAKSSSFLASLHAQQDRELQQRVASMILSDLLTGEADAEMSSPAVVASLLQWLQTHGAADSLLDIRYLGKREGHGVFAAQALPRDHVTLEVPFKLTMSAESAVQSDLAPVWRKYPEIPPDELLALHLMHERGKGSTSFFAPFIASLPREFDLPVFWSDAELLELKGTNVLLLTQMMRRQLERDFEGIHEPIAAEFPEIFAALPKLTLDDYTWAMSVIWSRAFGATKNGKYMHVLCPAMDMFNHDVQLQNLLDDFVTFDGVKQVVTHRVAEDAAKGAALHISYGQYSNAKLLYSYGFVAPGNRIKAMDFWMKITPNDPYQKLKQTVLDSHELTREQTYDFHGTLFENDVDERLLATLRVILMDEQEIRQYKKAFEASILSVRNELAVYENLQSICRRKLANFSTTYELPCLSVAGCVVRSTTHHHVSPLPCHRLEEDEALLAEIEADATPRLAFAVQVRLEDKQVLVGVINTLEQWKLLLQTKPEQYPPSSTRHQTGATGE
ncbi:hypothetical protein BBJ28_00010634 [Nothophytophthora sp. Chile5]|nr:hypothetical protein BBJ28_00010634 [Nothophytophthora sp. Chile5]